MQKKILLVGESWTSTSTHVKGFDQFATATWHTGATDFLAALADSPYAITYMPAHAAATDFPLTLEALQEWDAIILSDIGANTLLLHPDTWLKSRRTANRLTLLHDYVAGGGALMMIGGYYSFQGINGGARYRHTEVEKVLPVRCLAWDDRIETPEGCYAEVTESHPLFNDIPGEWPWLLGYNEVEMHPEGKLLTTVAGTGHPLLAVREYQQGRSLVPGSCWALTPSTRRAAKPTACGSSPTGLTIAVLRFRCRRSAKDAAILSPACPGRRAVNRWPLPDIWIPSRWEMPAGSTILSARRWKTGVFMAADPAI